MATKKEMADLQAQLDEAMSELAVANQVIVSQAAEIEKISEEPEPQLAKNNPVQISLDRVDTDGIDIVQQGERVMQSTGLAKDSLSAPEIPVIDQPLSIEKLESIKFMEEEITIRVHDTTDGNAVPVPPVWNRGKVQYFVRGTEQTVKRKYVERLARAKYTTFTQREERNDAGDPVFVQVPHTALLYPFELIHDPNPKGRQWLADIVAEPA